MVIQWVQCLTRPIPTSLNASGIILVNFEDNLLAFYSADTFPKLADGVTQRDGTTKCHACRQNRSPCHPPNSATMQIDKLYCGGCPYDTAFLQAYLVRKGFLGPTIQHVPNTIAVDTCNMILLLLANQFVS
jgi:hypothetical protein